MNKDNVIAIRNLLGYTTDLRVKLPYNRAVRSNISNFIDKNMSLFTDVTYADDKDLYLILLFRYTQMVIDPTQICR